MAEELSLFKISNNFENKKQQGITLADLRLEPNAKLKFETAYTKYPEIMQRETEKLYAYSKGKKQIGMPDLVLLCRRPLESNVFEFSEALFQGNKAKAYNIMYRELEYGSDPFGILNLLINEIRIMLWIKTAKNTTAKVLGIHPFRFKKLYTNSRNLSLEKLQQLYCFFADADIKIKTGAWDPVVALELFISFS